MADLQYRQPTSDAHFKMSGDELRKLADAGDRHARSEVKRRADNRRFKRQHREQLHRDRAGAR